MFPIYSRIEAARRCSIGRLGPCLFLFLLPVLGVLLNPAWLRAQSSDTATTDQKTIKLLMERVDKLEARVRQLEEAQRPAMAVAARETAPATGIVAGPGPADASHPQTVPQNQPASATTPPAQEQPEPTEHAESERMDLSKTLLRIRGFGDVTLHGDNYHQPTVIPPTNIIQPVSDKTVFTLGQLNLFVTSDISDRFKFLSEIVFEAGPDNIYAIRRGEANTFGVDVERYLLTYSQNDYFSISAGRYHTAIGYYNTAFHHSTWLQTTTGRPLLFSFEDQGGILPIHNIGVEAYGRIPSGPLGLHYIVEVGNGRESRNPIDLEPVQNIISDKTHKAFNVALFARPAKVPGLQVGFSAYHDLLVPDTQPVPVGETILAGHAVYTTNNFEWLNEAMVIRHTLQGGHDYQTPGWYSQISRRWGSYRPYFRYQYINASNNEPIFPDVQLRAGPQAGLRFDASESVALKLQYDYTALRNQHATQGLEAQVGFTF